METMELLVKKIIDDYPHFVQEVSQLEYHLSQRENHDMRDAVATLWFKINAVESWFTLLEPDERFVFRQMLAGAQQENAAQRAAAMMWMWQILKEGQTPWAIRERALEKITSFVSAHKAAMLAVFDNE